ncbi:hypothetical protein MY3296_008568 [Beauveria thailandica]
MLAWSLSSNFLSHPSTGLLGSETGTNVALWTPALSVLPLSPTGVMDGLRLSASDSSIPLMSKVNGYPFLDVWRKKQGVACRMCPSAAILSKRAGAAKRVCVQAYVQSDTPKKQNDSNFRFPHGSIAASKQTNTLAHGATKRIRIVIGSGRRSEAA